MSLGFNELTLKSITLGHIEWGHVINKYDKESLEFLKISYCYIISIVTAADK